MPNQKEIILSDQAPKPIGPYSQAVRAPAGRGLVFFSGQIALDPVSGQMVGTDVETQAKQVMENVRALLKAAGCTFDSIVKTTIFLKSMGDFPKVNEIYGSYITQNPPARSTVEVSQLPKGALVEVEVIAISGA